MIFNKKNPTWKELKEYCNTMVELEHINMKRQITLLDFDDVLILTIKHNPEAFFELKINNLLTFYNKETIGLCYHEIDGIPHLKIYTDTGFMNIRLSEVKKMMLLTTEAPK